MKGKRKTVRQKSAIKAATEPKRVYIIQSKVIVHLHDIQSCHTYMHRLQRAILELGATVAAEGIVCKMGVVQNKSITDEHDFLSIAPTDMDGLDVSVHSRN